MMEKWIPIRELMTEISTEPTWLAQMLMTVPVTINGTTTNVLLITTADLEQEFNYSFGDRVWLDPFASLDTEDIHAAASRFKDMWTTWKTRRADAYGRMLSTMTAEALTDPTENYDRKEVGGWKDTHDAGQRVRDTEYTPAVINTQENYMAGDDSATPVLASKSVSTPGGQKDQGKTTDQKVTDTDTRLFQDYRVHGNIGVSTAADMAEKILTLHTKDLTMQAIREFIDLYTIYRR